MRLTDLMAASAIAFPHGTTVPDDVQVTGVTCDSRKVEPGYVFAALPGTKRQGIAFAEEAVARGAVALLAQREIELEPGSDVVMLYSSDVHADYAALAAGFYAPSPPLCVAVTGTDGKTSIAHYCREIWELLGYRAASLGTLGVIGVKNSPLAGLENTTPEAGVLHKHLQMLAREGYGYAVLEASSHGLEQCRLEAVTLKAAAFSNLSQDHLDYHADLEAYFRAKARLFSELLPPGAAAVINADDARAPLLREIAVTRGHRLIDFGYQASRLRLTEVTLRPDGCQHIAFTLDGHEYEVTTPLVGRFQAHNLLAALGLVLGSGDAGAAESVAALEKVGPVPGRMERVMVEGVGEGKDPRRVYADYAHTPRALEQALLSLRPYAKGGGALAVVFGCGGDRDAGKRLQMGEVAGQLADRIIVTDDNPRSENAAAIRAAVRQGCPESREIADRGEAIAQAVKEMKTGDVLLIAGKGHETGQIVGDRVLPFDDREVAALAMKEEMVF